MKKTYELFTGKDLEIAEKIQQRRYQMLIHSCLYYHLNQNVISDKQWDAWARELRDLQNEYPDISSPESVSCGCMRSSGWIAGTGTASAACVQTTFEKVHQG